MAEFIRYQKHNGRTYDMMEKDERQSFYCHKRQSRGIEEDRRNEEARRNADTQDEDSDMPPEKITLCEV